MSRTLIEKSKWIVRKLQDSLDDKLNNEYDFNLLFNKLEALLGVSMSLTEKSEKFFQYHEIVIVGSHEKLDKTRIQSDLKKYFGGQNIVIHWVSFSETKKYNFRNLDGDLKTTDLIIENRDHRIKDERGLQLLLNRPLNFEPKVIDYKDYMNGVERKLSNTGIIDYITNHSDFNNRYESIFTEGDEFD